MFATANKKTLTLCMRAICRHNDNNKAARAGYTTRTQGHGPSTTRTARPRACCNENSEATGLLQREQRGHGPSSATRTTRPRGFVHNHNNARATFKFNLISREEERTPRGCQDTRYTVELKSMTGTDHGRLREREYLRDRSLKREGPTRPMRRR